MRHFVHGTDYSYKAGKCRCLPCKEAHRLVNQADRIRRRAMDCPRYLHGTESGYTHYGCRCRPCTTAMTEARKARSKKKNLTPEEAFSLISALLEEKISMKDPKMSLYKIRQIVEKVEVGHE